ncbi:unnamed protein product [Rhizopus stolonifer]
MTDTIQLYNQEAEEVYPTIFLNTFQEKMNKRLSFSKLLQKTPSIMGRKLSLFSRPKKAELKLMIPMTLERKDSNSTDSSDEELKTPTNESFTYSTTELETAVTTPSSKNMMDYSGQGYSNFYIKLPNGNWMVRVRDKNRKIIGTFEIDGSMI